MGQKLVVSVNPEAGAVTLQAPFYRSSIQLDDITSVEAHEDDGLNHGPVNWFVAGRADSPEGVRLNTGGKGRIDITTASGQHYSVVMDTLQQARDVKQAISAAWQVRGA
ncbi:hypothetical protein ACX31A_09750 [Dermacoccus nishinomiyaensis]